MPAGISPHGVGLPLHLLLRRSVCKTGEIGGSLRQRRRLSVASRYSVFGFGIESSLELPELFGSYEAGLPRWRIQKETRQPPPDGNSVAVGSDTVLDGIAVRAFRTDAGMRLMFDDTGTFDIRSVERLVVWYPGSSANPAAVRADLLGRVMAVCAHLDGRVSLHASAVSIGGLAVAFLGPKHAGKSTMALALVRNGARLLTDDTLVVRIDAKGAAWAAPGVQRVRLWDDSVRALGLSASGDAGAKPTVDCLTRAELETTEVPLRACYVLQGSTDACRVVADRARLSPVHAALACVRYSKLGALAGGSEGQIVLDRVAALTSAVPVFEATVERDLERLEGLARAFIAWHASPNAERPAP